ncbi:MAG TPA: PmoA family protein [Verrucomicrobiae bacterium]|nr:PmoA family protein [Verrucomicrobiae bacterium]
MFARIKQICQSEGKWNRDSSSGTARVTRAVFGVSSNTLCLISVLMALVLTACSTTQKNDPTSGVKIIQESNVVRVELNGKLFTEYHYKNVPRPYFYPVIGPEGLAMTRHWPQEEFPGEEHDHPHHHSLWFAHGSVNGLDFWSEAEGYCKIVHDGFTELKSGEKSGVIRSRDKWVSTNGAVVCTDDRTFRVWNAPNGVLFDFDVTIHASNGDVTFDDSKEGTMAMRLAESMKLKWKNKAGKGHIVNSNGVRDEKTWGKSADWVDYYGPVDGKIVGVAIFDNPANPRHPTTWHVRDYGLFAANPFGVHEFEKKPEHAGDMKIPAGQSVTFRYRFYLHEGDAKQAHVAKMYREYANSAQP